MAYKGSGKLDTLASLYAKLEEKDSGFKRKIDLIISNNGPGSCLLRLMQISHGCNNFPSKLCDIFMEKYQEIDPRLKFYSFNINDILINVTLDDVLFITGLPIDGKPVISDTGYDEGAFLSIFGIDKKVLYITELADIACGQEPDDRRIYAILLIVIVSIVAPTGDGHVCRSSYVKFIKNLDDVNNYAWGAALLSFLYRGMRRYKTEEKKFVDGNTWVLLSFMLFHIPKLQQELQIDLTVQPPTPLLFSVVNSLEKIGRDHYSRYVPKVTALLNSLDATDIKWHPYTREMLPAMVQEQISFTTRLSPLFCLNYVEHHLPHLLANQFELLEGLDIDVAQDALQPIVFKANKGKSGSNFLKHYEKELLAWTMRRILALERSTSPTQIVSESSLSPPDTHIQLGAVVQITPLTHIAFEYSPPPRDTPVQHAEERSTSPTQIVTESSLSPLDTHIQLSAEAANSPHATVSEPSPLPQNSPQPTPELSNLQEANSPQATVSELFNQNSLQQTPDLEEQFDDQDYQTPPSPPASPPVEHHPQAVCRRGMPDPLPEPVEGPRRNRMIPAPRHTYDTDHVAANKKRKARVPAVRKRT